MTALSIRNLSKNYGTFAALKDFSAEIAPGTVFGLLGPNGAGKTTTFKCLLGLSRADSGEALFDGMPLQPQFFDRIAYVPEKSVLYDWMTIGQHLEMQKRAFSAFSARRAEELLALFDLDPRKRVRNLSKGMRTGAALVMAFSANPDLLVLDEPTSGLDPLNQRAVLKLIIDAAADGKTIIFSSHQIGQVERAAEHIAILQNGKLLLAGAVEDLKSEYKIVEGIFSDERISSNGLARDPRVTRVETTGRVLRTIVRDDSSGVAAELERLGASNVRMVDLNLEDIFLNAVSPNTPAGEIVEQA
ncbi:MAG: hypothetical protein DLM50_07105 [Candidatus Meridianibacter frigidus]|nr:MAG: hypothetical protein DLM50_07105 [Candidatus Eremiobacteraeota bacterium]